MIEIQITVVCKHEGSLDSSTDIIMNVTGTTFKEIEKGVIDFINDYNKSQQERSNPIIYDWFIANKTDLVELLDKIDAYEGKLGDEKE